MPRIPLGRSAALAITLACALSPSTHADGWPFHKKCQPGCCDTTVKLPAQRVVVETAAPRVTVQDSARLSRGIATPVLGTVYMPMSMPVAGVGIGQRDVESPPEDNPLRTVHAAEVAKLRQARASAAAKAEIEAAQRVLDRLNASSDCSKPQPDACKPQTDLGQRIKLVGEKIDKLADRLNAVEKLSLIHDNYLSKDFQKTPPPKPAKQ